MFSASGQKAELDELEPLMAFLDAVARDETPAAAVDTVQRTIRSLGLKHFALRVDVLQHAGHTNTSSVSNLPEAWTRRIIEARHYDKSVVFRMARKRRAPFNWFDILQDPDTTDAEWRVHQEAQEFGFGLGLAVPVHPAGRPLSVFIAGSDPDHDPSADVIRRRCGALHLLGLGFYECLAPMLRSGQIRRDEANGPDSAANDNLASSSVRQRQSRALTSFERDFLAWTSVGVDSWTISERVGLPVGQVERALASAERKLAVGTRAHAVVKAIVDHIVVP